MKTLSLIRHAHAKNGGSSDLQRPLSSKGKSECVSLAEQLQTHHWMPDMLSISHALRTQTTANIVQQTLNAKFNMQTEREIYEASYLRLIKCIQKTSEEIQHLCMIGHNPGFSELSNYLDQQQWVNLSPANAVVLELNIDQWHKIKEGVGKCLFFVIP